MTPGADRFEATRAVLVVVDVQRDFCAPDGALARRGRDVSSVGAVVTRLLRLVDDARSASVPVVFVTTAHSAGTHSDEWRFRCGDDDPPDICAEGSRGAELYRLVPSPDEAIVVKRRYSAFGAPGFEAAVASTGRRSLLFCGVATNVCVETSLRDAVCADYFVTLVGDCSAAYSAESHEATLRTVRQSFGLVTTAEELRRKWIGEPAAGRWRASRLAAEWG